MQKMILSDVPNMGVFKIEDGVFIKTGMSDAEATMCVSTTELSDWIWVDNDRDVDYYSRAMISY